MRSNESELTKNFPELNKEKYKTPKWVGWFNLIYVIALIPVSIIIVNAIFDALKIYIPSAWQTALDGKTIYGLAAFFLYPIVIVGFIYIFKYLNDNFLIKDLFRGETDYIIAYQENINLQKILDIEAKKVPLNTKIFIFAYNREQEAKLIKRNSQHYRREVRSAVEEAAAQGVTLNPDQYPVLSIKKSEKHQNGNVNLIQTINVPTTETKVKLEQYLPDTINLKSTEIPLQIPSFQEGILTELVVRVTVYSENEFLSFYEVLLNPMETAFCVEI